MLANHILQNFLSAENFPEWKWAFSIIIIKKVSFALKLLPIAVPVVYIQF